MSESIYLAKYNLPNIFRIGPVMFIPGINKISKSNWDEIKDHPLLPFRFDNKHIEWVEGKGPENKPSELDDLSDFKAGEAIELVKSTYNLDLLEVWKNAETRKGVSAAIDEQLNALLEQPAETKE